MPVGGEAGGQLVRVGDLGELALRVGAAAFVEGALEERVVEVEGGLAEGGDHHDPRGGRAFEQRQQALGEDEARQVVDREAQLDPVFALLAVGRVGQAAADPGVVDQQVEGVERGDLVGEAAAPRPARRGPPGG